MRSDDKAIRIIGDWLPSFQTNHPFGGICIGNLECAFSDVKISSYKAYSAILPQECIENVISSNFAALSVANNHSADAYNFQSTVKELQTRAPQIQFFGTNKKPYAEFIVGRRNIAVIGCLEKCRSRMSELFPEEAVLTLIPSLKTKYDIVYIYPHWGKESEYTRYPNPRQIKLAHKWIDVGADGVFGSHSHVFQGYEEYHGKPVFYSLGNFFFPHPESKLYPGTDLGMTVEITPSTGDYHPHFHRFDESGFYAIQNESDIHTLLQQISTILSSWNYRKWGKEIGGFYIRKNMASWRKRMWKKFPINFLKFLVWNIMPLTVWFRICSMVSPKTVSND